MIVTCVAVEANMIYPTTGGHLKKMKMTASEGGKATRIAQRQPASLTHFSTYYKQVGIGYKLIQTHLCPMLFQFSILAPPIIGLLLR